jgi:hypothetical protein
MASRGGKGKAANQPNREELFNMAVEAAKQGNRQGARMMFRQIVGEDRKNTRAMMWLAKIAGSKKERDQWLKKVLDINPNHEAAQAALSKIQHGDTAQRNRMMMKIGIGAYVLVTLLLAFVILLSAAG